ncbi:MAG TPA: hypothetical protein ENN18_08780 [Proteobacteria bacterium]|nr:hypothetical protein [Pseudomonadota bacterium]
MKRYLAVILMVFLLPSAALADQTLLTGTSVQTSLTTQYVDASIEVGKITSGVLSAAFTGTYTSTEFYFYINSGTYSGYACSLQEWVAEVGGNSYSGVARSLWALPASPYDGAAIDGAIGAVASGSDPTLMDITSFLGTQYSGSFTPTETSETPGDVNVNVTSMPLYIETRSFDGAAAGYYNGNLDAALVHLDPDLSAFGVAGLPDLRITLVNYTSDAGPGTAFDIWDGTNGLGGIDGSLYGILREYPDGSVVIEHAGTAPPIPIPGAVWLLGSGLVGLLALKRRRKE